MWAAIEENNLMVFLHPHYGIGNEHFHGTGHALALALGFPFEVQTRRSSPGRSHAVVSVMALVLTHFF